MLKTVKKYSGVLFFYMAIAGMVLLVSARMDYLENHNSVTTYAMSK